MNKLIEKIRNCSTYRDLYYLSKDLLENGLALATTVNGTKVLCAIREGKIVTDKIFSDFIFVEGENNDIINHTTQAIILDFINKNVSNEKLKDNTPIYQRNVEFYGKPIPYATEMKLLGEQQVRYISRFIQD